MIWIPALAAWYSMRVNQMEWERLHANSTVAPVAFERRSESVSGCDRSDIRCERLWTQLSAFQSDDDLLDCEAVLQYDQDCLYIKSQTIAKSEHATCKISRSVERISNS